MTAPVVGAIDHNSLAPPRGGTVRLRIQRQLGDPVGVADALTRLADVARCRADFDLAGRCAAEGLAIRRVKGSALGNASSLIVLGSTLSRSGQLEAGRRHLDEARALFAAIDEFTGLAACYGWLGELALLEGDLDVARAELGAALRGFREMPDAWMVANVCDLYCWLAVLESDSHRTMRLAGAAAAIRQTVGASQPPALAASISEVLAEARHRLGSGADAVWRQGAEAAFELVTAYALREVTWPQTAVAGAVVGPGHLRARELEVVPLVARGLANKEIAVLLGISARTAEYHIDRIRKKLGFASRTQIATWSVAGGLERQAGRIPVGC